MSSGAVNVELFRDSLSTPWGFRLYGGKDLRSPLTIQKVFPCSPSEGDLRLGDVLLAIGEADVTQATHEEAEKLIKKAGGSIKLTVLRSPQSQLPLTPLGMPGNPASAFKNSRTHCFGVDFRRGPGHAPPAYSDAAYLELQRSLNAAATWHPSAGTPRKLSYEQLPSAPVPYVHRQSSHDGSARPRPMTVVQLAPAVPSSGPSSSSTAAHLQYNSPLQLYSRGNAEDAKKAQLGNHPAADTIQITGGAGGKKTDMLDSPTLRMVLKEDAAKAKLGREPGPAFYARHHEFGPGIGPIRQYCEAPIDEGGLSDF